MSSPCRNGGQGNMALSCISPSSSGHSWQRWAPDERWGEEVVKGVMTDGSHHTFLPRCVFTSVWHFKGYFPLSITQRHAGRWDCALERPGRRIYQGGTSYTCGKVWLYKLKSWLSLQRNMGYPASIPKSLGSLGFPFPPREKVFFQWSELLTQTFADP